MRHLGDITKINGAEIEPVDVVTGGSPCQDLSVAGRREGLAGERSGLFMEQIRIVKEMRENDRRKGRTTELCRPRFMVWENVTGALSSNKGKDFQAVLTEIVRIAEPEVPDVPMPEGIYGGKWPKVGCLHGEMGGWSVAWRVHDSQYWGVPQRRKRIAVVADFGGLAAGEILFDPQYRRETEDSESVKAVGDTGGEPRPEIQPLGEGVPGHLKPGGEAWEEAAGATECGASEAGEAISFQERAGKPGGGKGILIQEEKTGSLSTLNNQKVMTIDARQQSMVCQEEKAATLGANAYKEPQAVLCLNDQGGAVMDVSEEQTGTLRAQEHGHQPIVYGIGGFNSEGMLSSNPNSGIYEADTSRTLDNNGGNPACNQGGMIVLEGDGSVAPTITGDHENRVTDYTAVCVGNGQTAQMGMHDKTYALDCMHDQQAVMVAAVDCRNGMENPNVNGTMQAKEQGQNLNSNNVCRTDSVVRRLTPLECTRLQGFPDGWVDIGEWVDGKGKRRRDADAPKYKALGNSIALPFWQWLARQISAQYEQTPTMGGLFSGIGGFELCWARTNGVDSVRWSSEIEPFPVAVMKRRFGDEDDGVDGDVKEYL